MADKTSVLDSEPALGENSVLRAKVGVQHESRTRHSTRWKTSHTSLSWWSSPAGREIRCREAH